MSSHRKASNIILHVFCCLPLLLSACTTTPQADRILDTALASGLQAMELRHVAFFPQQQYQCGPAALATVLQASGIDIAPPQLTPLIYIPEKKGSLQLELLTATRRLGRIPYVLAPRLDHLLEEVQTGKPVLVFQNLGLDWLPQWHYAVVVGYDLVNNEIVLRSGLERRHRISLQLFERTWARADYWALLILQAGELPKHVDQAVFLNALLGMERVKKWPLLIESYAVAVRKWPHNLALHMGLANSYYANQQLKLARQHYRNIIQLQADYAPAYNNLAQTYIDTQQLKMALKFAKQAVELDGALRSVYQKTLKEIQVLLDK